MTEYGILNEQSDVRVHVCPRVKRVYVFPTESGIEAINSGRYRKKKGYQKGVRGETAEGFLVPPMDIRGIVSLTFRPEVWRELDFIETDSESEKGGKAVRLVKLMVKAGLLPLPGSSSPPDLEADVQGTDLTFRLPEMEQRVQVKCDYPGGERLLGGTGYLYLQVAERNPRGKTDRVQ